PSPAVVSRVPPIVALIPADTTSTPSSTSIDQDAPSASTLPTTQETQSLVIHQGVEEQLQETKNAQFDNDPFQNIFTPETLKRLAESEEEARALTYDSWIHQFRTHEKPIFLNTYVPPTKKDRDILFQPIFDGYFQPSPAVVSRESEQQWEAREIQQLERAETVVSRVPPIVALIPADTTSTPSSTSTDQDAPSASTLPTTQETQYLVIHQGVEEQLQETKKCTV
nr:hypothetical protein [Tanacetum cinerariifolium]